MRFSGERKESTRISEEVKEARKKLKEIQEKLKIAPLGAFIEHAEQVLYMEEDPERIEMFRATTARMLKEKPHLQKELTKAFEDITSVEKIISNAPEIDNIRETLEWVLSLPQENEDDE